MSEKVIRFCDTCLFATGETSLSCRRYPPVMLQEDLVNQIGSKYVQVTSWFPTVSGDDWCGEYKSKEPS